MILERLDLGGVGTSRETQPPLCGRQQASGYAAFREVPRDPHVIDPKAAGTPLERLPHIAVEEVAPVDGARPPFEDVHFAMKPVVPWKRYLTTAVEKPTAEAQGRGWVRVRGCHQRLHEMRVVDDVIIDRNNQGVLGAEVLERPEQLRAWPVVASVQNLDGRMGLDRGRFATMNQ